MLEGVSGDWHLNQQTEQEKRALLEICIGSKAEERRAPLPLDPGHASFTSLLLSADLQDFELKNLQC